ncbi:hypothetical protein IMCC1933_21260 [Rhodobacteraceae bacterium IMCC1933]|nr:hypothetical protein [Rhodobacteraceae bacterium IMCC1923]MDP4068568.1 hypothetical protein [Rhodobacteraceae bacterium IMCC1933]MDP4070293.1 hypothetical protein [Rhodobacteraceae bacterium IMCC1909]
MERVEQIYQNNYSIYNIMFYIVYYGLIGKRYLGPRRRCVSYMEFAPLAPPLYFGIQTMPRSCKRSSTLRNESGNRTYSATAKRIVSGLVLKYLNGECFVICGFYKYTLLASTEFNLTVPTDAILWFALFVKLVFTSIVVDGCFQNSFTSMTISDWAKFFG